MKITIITAADAKFFYLVRGLLLSIQDNRPNPNVQIRLFDVGLTTEQRQYLENFVDGIVSANWEFDFPRQNEYPAWFKAFVARPFLPKYFPDRDIYIWLDADAWVQNWSAIETLIDAAKSGDMAIVQERFGKGLFIKYLNEQNKQRVFSITPDLIQKNISSCYRLCYGENIAAKYGKLPPINAGVWAMRRDVPNWHIWAEYLREGLHRGRHLLVEQQSLNLAIHSGDISARLLPRWCNWVCIHELPLLDSESCKFVVPENPLQQIGILHLADMKEFATLTVSKVPSGKDILPLEYLGFQKWRKNQCQSKGEYIQF